MAIANPHYPYDPFAEHNGVELVALDASYAKAKLVVQPHHKNGLGSVHGGAIFLLADFTAVNVATADGKLRVALNVSINYVTAPRGKELYAEVWGEGGAGRVQVFAGKVTDDQDQLIALVQFMGLEVKH
jgi:acyl-CoA thioesterase